MTMEPPRDGPCIAVDGVVHWTRPGIRNWTKSEYVSSRANETPQVKKMAQLEDGLELKSGKHLLLKIANYRLSSVRVSVFGGEM